MRLVLNRRKPGPCCRSIFYGTGLSHMFSVPPGKGAVVGEEVDACCIGGVGQSWHGWRTGVETQPWMARSTTGFLPPDSHGCPRGRAIGRELAVRPQVTRKPQEQLSCGLARDLKHRLSGQEPESHSPTHRKSREVGREPRTGPSPAAHDGQQVALWPRFNKGGGKVERRGESRKKN